MSVFRAGTGATHGQRSGSFYAGGVNRRVIGITVVAFALLAVLVVPGLVARPLAGRATTIPIPAPPQVGDCVLDPIGPAVSDTTTNTWVLPSPRYGRCGPAHTAEVIEVAAEVPAVSTDPITGQPVAGTQFDPVVGVCGRTLAGYIGMDGVTGDGEFDGWIPSFMVGTAVIGPHPWQRADGQRWAACVVMASDEHGLTVPMSTVVRGALRTGTMGSQFGLCLNLIGTTSSMVPCAEVHRTEWFGNASWAADAAKPGVTLEGCRRLVAAATLIPAATIDRSLTIEVDVEQADRSGDVAEHGATADEVQWTQATCKVTARNGRSLEGSLLGLGTRPIPLAG